MYPFANQEMAKYHRKDLMREAALEQALASAHRQVTMGNPIRKQFALFSNVLNTYNRRTFLSARPVVLQQIATVDPDFAEIKRDLQATLAALRRTDPVCEDTFIESFMQKLRNRVSHNGTVLLVQPSPLGRRLVLAMAFLCVLMPLAGIVLGVSQSILLGGCLLCLFGVGLTLILRLV